MPDPRDGEVSCPVCGTALNREDANCWRCGNTSLDKSRLRIELGQEGMLAEDPSFADRYVRGMWSPSAPVPAKVQLFPRMDAHDTTKGGNGEHAACDVCFHQLGGAGTGGSGGFYRSKTRLMPMRMPLCCFCGKSSGNEAPWTVVPTLVKNFLGTRKMTSNLHCGHPWI